MRQILFALLMSYVLCASATPGDVSDGKVVTNNTTSNVFRDLEDPKRLWVLPPTEGVLGNQVDQIVVTRPQCDLIVEVHQDLLTLYRTLRNIRTQELNALEAADSAASGGAVAADAAHAKYAALRKSAMEQQEQIDKYLVKHGNLFGGNVSLTYTTEWQSNVARIRAMNPAFPLVEAMPTKDLRIFFAIPGSVQDGIGAEKMPVIMNYTVQGLTASNAVSQGIGMSDKIGVDLSLTQMGGCFIKYPALFGGNLKPTFSLATVYSYPRSYASKIDATYNLLSIYKYLQRNGSSGGFFSSKSWSETVESNRGESAFKMNWT